MKSVFALIAMLVSVSAMAENDVNGYQPNYDYSNAAPIFGCAEGQRETVLETTHDAGEAITRPVTYTCKNGRFVARSSVKVTQCRTGSTSIVLENNSDAGEPVSHPVAYVCRAGKWFRQ